MDVSASTSTSLGVDMAVQHQGEPDLDPRIQLELEKLNTETSEINKLELELEESNTTFRMLLNEATRRLKGLAQRLGNSVERARPYHEAAIAAQDARAACQRAAVAYQRASEIHAAAKETVTLAEQRFKTNQHEWQFDNAWQEMLNHATIKVMDADNKKSESGREHHEKTLLFKAAESKLQHLEDQLRRHVIKSRPYFDEKQLCQEQLATQKERIEYLQDLISKAKFRYSQSLKTLESISEEIHMKRRDLYEDIIESCPVGPREPGVGAEHYPDYTTELASNDLTLRNPSPITDNEDTGTLEELRRRVRRLAVRPVEGGATTDTAWENELNETVNRLDQMLMMRERVQHCKVNNQSTFVDQHSCRTESVSDSVCHQCDTLDIYNIPTNIVPNEKVVQDMFNETSKTDENDDMSINNYMKCPTSDGNTADDVTEVVTVTENKHTTVITNLAENDDSLDS